LWHKREGLGKKTGNGIDCGVLPTFLNLDSP
jgi:hypothetical protein